MALRNTALAIFLSVSSAAVALVPGLASAQSYADAAAPAVWGDSSERVLEIEREVLMEAYRLQVAGLSDPLQIDEIRRRTDVRIREVEASLRVLDQPRTGFEVSVLQDEVRGEVGMSVLSSRDDEGTKYYVFKDDGLSKVVRVYEQAAFGYVDFEAFTERLRAAYGEPTAAEWSTDDIGVKHLLSASWSDGVTTIRAADKTRLFSAFVVTFADQARDSHYPQAVTGSPTRRGRTDVGSLMDSLEAGGGASNEGVVDEIVGGPVDDVLEVRETEVAEPAAEAAPATTPEAAAEGSGSGSSRRRRSGTAEPVPAEDGEEEPDEAVIY